MTPRDCPRPEMSRPHRRKPRGFTIIDTLVATAAIVTLAGAVQVAGNAVDLQGQRDTDMLNLAWYSGLGASYAADNDGRYWSFTWQPGEANSEFADLADLQTSAPTINQAHAAQAADILRHRSPIDQDIIPGFTIPEARFSFLVLADYAGIDLPDPRLVPSGAGAFAAVARDYSLAETDIWGDNFADFSPEFRTREYFRSLFQTSASFLQWVDRGENALKLAGSTYDFWNAPSLGVDRIRRLSEVRFPAQKVLQFSSFDFYSDADSSQFYGLDNSRVSVLFTDGSVQYRRAGDANPGWDPTRPTSSRPFRFFYDPIHSGWPAIPEDTRVISVPRMLVTRGGLDGIDFDGPDIDTGPRFP